ncbi:MAG TPA: aminotransferase class V-fold PLP-dependent enzyme, partial [Bacillota bacterium]|nr:aminotransferase class V-fold PLP-dependent enzyme [Bacillota bacterium]
VITSSREHNAVSRPLHFMESRGLEVSKIPGNEQDPIDIAKLEEAIKPNTKALIINHASNVTGEIMPLAQLGQIARRHNLVFIVDGAQTAGVLDIDVEAMNIDLLACTGHKGLLGPQGTGCLCVREGIQLTPLRFGGTGSSSEYLDQPEEYPDRLESGTPNTPGIAGLGAGVDFIREAGIAAIREHERQLTKRMWEGLRTIKGVSLYGPEDPALRAPVISFTLEGQDTGHVGFVLDQVYGIACRTGLHCAPDAHRAAGTFPGGTVRLSLSYFNTAEEIDKTISAVKELAEELNG